MTERDYLGGALEGQDPAIKQRKDPKTQKAIERLRDEYGDNLIPKSTEPKKMESSDEALAKLKTKMTRQERWDKSTIGKIWNKIKEI